MKGITRHFLLLLAAAGFGLAAGVVLRGGAAHRSSSAAEAVSLASYPTSVRQEAKGPSPADYSLAAKLERALSISSGVKRWLLWLEAIEQAQPADFPQLARLAQNNRTALRFVAGRWAELYPRQFFDSLVAALGKPGSLPVRELTDILFKDWAKQDPDAAIQALNGATNFGMRDSWRNLVAETVVENDPERGIRLLAEWSIDRFGPRMNAIAKWAGADPRHAAEFTLQNPAGYVSQLTMETIAREWTRTDPSAALEFATARTGDLAMTLASAALKEWAGRDLAQAANWLAHADDQTRQRLASALVEPWAKQDAPAALAWSQANLSGSSLTQAAGSVLKGAAETDIAEAAALVTSLEPSPARAQAAAAVAKKWFPELSGGQPAEPRALSWLNQLDPSSVKSVLDEIAWGWATTDPASMAAFLLTPNAGQVASSVYTVLARQLVLKNPVGAFEWANALPSARAISAGSEAFASWRSTSPQAAMQWFNALPDSDPRRQPYFESAVRTLAWGDPQAPEQFAAMSPAERNAARGVIEQMTLPEERRASLLGALTSK